MQAGRPRPNGDAMNCPDCHCTREGPFTETSPSGLVTRCHHAFHAVAVSPARPDDFATETAKDTDPPTPTHHGAANAAVGVYCPVHGQDRCSHAGECVGLVCVAQSRGEFKSPFDPNPPKLIPADNGWIFCATCESPQPVSGHECVPVRCLKCGKSEWEGAWVCACDSLDAELSRAEMRAEFAESLLCAMAWSHGLDKRDHESHSFGPPVVEFYPLCAVGRCVFCDAARGGGR